LSVCELGFHRFRLRGSKSETAKGQTPGLEQTGDHLLDLIGKLVFIAG
jgi:hypothetical protein